MLDDRRQYLPSSPIWSTRKTSQHDEAVGRSRCGLTTKIHAAVNALGNLVCLILTAGQASEYDQANALIEGFSVNCILADKGYDSDAFILAIRSAGDEPVIPPGKGRFTAKVV